MILLIVFGMNGYLLVFLIIRGIFGIEKRRIFVDLIFIIWNKWLLFLFNWKILCGVLLFLNLFFLLIRIDLEELDVLFKFVFSNVIGLNLWFYFCKWIMCWLLIGIFFLCFRIMNVLYRFIFCWFLMWEWY